MARRCGVQRAVGWLLALALVGMSDAWLCSSEIGALALQGVGPFAPFEGVSVDACARYPPGSRRAGEPMPQDAPGHVQVRVSFQAALAEPTTVTFNYNSGTSQAVAPASAQTVGWHDVGAFVPVSTQVEWAALLPGMTVACNPSCTIAAVEARVIQCDCREGEANDACDLAAAPQSDDESCKNCTAGFFQDEWAQPACEACPIGTKQPLPTQAACEPCGDGFYTDAPGQTTCKVCPAGQTNNTASDGCAACPAGTVALVAGSACERCPPQQVAASATECVVCSNPWETASEDGTQCVTCGPGWWPDPGKQGCQKCAPGSYSDGERQTVCFQCPRGTFQDEEGQSECKVCFPGTFAGSEGSTECAVCPPGEVQLGSGGGDCRRCAPGYAANKLKTSCVLCAAGSAGPVGSDECQFCEPGTYQGEPGREECLPCPVNTYQPLKGARDCNLCAEGSGAEAGATRCTMGLVVSGAQALAAGPLLLLLLLLLLATWSSSSPR